MLRFEYISVSSGQFTLRVHHDGEFSKDKKQYIGGQVHYFDMCSDDHFYLVEMESMLEEIGLVNGSYDMWFCIVGDNLDNDLMPLETDEHVKIMLDLLVYQDFFNVYITTKDVGFDDFSFTQYELDEREERIGDIREETDTLNLNEEFGGYEGSGDEDDKQSFQGDLSNIDSSDSEVEITPKKIKTIPPPNPPTKVQITFERVRTIPPPNPPTEVKISPKKKRRIPLLILPIEPEKREGIPCLG